jgi:hypothetical protein
MTKSIRRKSGSRIHLEDKHHGLKYNDRLSKSTIKNSFEKCKKIDCMNGYIMILEVKKK